MGQHASSKLVTRPVCMEAAVMGTLPPPPGQAGDLQLQERIILQLINS